jgi:hypothetical protein
VDRVAPEESIGNCADDARGGVDEVANSAASEKTNKSPLRPGLLPRGIDRLPAVGLEPEKDTQKHPDEHDNPTASARQMPSRLLRRIRIGVLPPGSYAVPKAGYTLVAMQGEHLADPASQRGIEKFPMALVGRGLRAEVSSSGLSCLVVHTAVNGGGKRRRLLLDEQKSWAVEDIQIWKTVYAAVKKVQAATDRVSERSSHWSTSMPLGRLTKSLILAGGS